MKRHELKSLISEVINEVVGEAIGLGVAEGDDGIKQHIIQRLAKLPKYRANRSALNAAVEKILAAYRGGNTRVAEMCSSWQNVNEADSGKKVNQQIADLLAQGHKVFSGAVGRIGQILSVDGNTVRIKRSRGRGESVTTFNVGDEVSIEQAAGGQFLVMNKDGLFETDAAGVSRLDRKARQKDHSNEPSFIASIDNTVFPFGEDELDKMAEEHHIRLRYLGDAAFGTETLRSYRVKVACANRGQLDAFVDMLAQEDGIEFYDTPQLAKKLEEGEMDKALAEAVLTPRRTK